MQRRHRIHRHLALFPVSLHFPFQFSVQNLKTSFSRKLLCKLQTQDAQDTRGLTFHLFKDSKLTKYLSHFHEISWLFRLEFSAFQFSNFSSEQWHLNNFIYEWNSEDFFHILSFRIHNVRLPRLGIFSRNDHIRFHCKTLQFSALFWISDLLYFHTLDLFQLNDVSMSNEFQGLFSYQWPQIWTKKLSTGSIHVLVKSILDFWCPLLLFRLFPRNLLIIILQELVRLASLMPNMPQICCWAQWYIFVAKQGPEVFWIEIQFQMSLCKFLICLFWKNSWHFVNPCS